MVRTIASCPIKYVHLSFAIRYTFVNSKCTEKWLCKVMGSMSLAQLDLTDFQRVTYLICLKFLLNRRIVYHTNIILYTYTHVIPLSVSMCTCTYIRRYCCSVLWWELLLQRESWLILKAAYIISSDTYMEFCWPNQTCSMSIHPHSLDDALCCIPNPYCKHADTLDILRMPK